jgi:geranylgeranyl diphosphate synthase type II
MLNLQDCQSIINKYINEIKLPGFPVNLYEPIRYMLELEAKRLRPALVLLGCNVYSDAVDEAIFPALAIEVFHNFTLVHDDIMDKSCLRRNKATVYVKWSASVAILSGDAMLIKAYELLSNARSEYLKYLLPVFNLTALQVCEGQQYDMDYENDTEVSIDDYLKMVEYKTAVLLAAALKIGALTGGASHWEADVLYEFGRNLGIAFQLQDDLLDVYADTDVFGKVTGNDIVANKKTILLVEALNCANDTVRIQLLDWVCRKNFDRDEKIRAIREIYTSLNLEALVRQRIKEYHLKALKSLASLNVMESRKAGLFEFSDYLMNRKK